MKKFNRKITDHIEELSDIQNSDKILVHPNETINSLVNDIKNVLNSVIIEHNSKIEEELKDLKWKYTALVFQNLFLYIAIIYFILTFVFIFLIQFLNILHQFNSFKNTQTFK